MGHPGSKNLSVNPLFLSSVPGVLNLRVSETFGLNFPSYIPGETIKDKRQDPEIYLIVLWGYVMYYGELVCLRAVEPADLDILIEHFNKLELRRFLGVPIPRSRHYLELWMGKRGSSDPWIDGLLELSILDKHTGEFLGFVHLEDIKKPHSRAEFGISILNPDYLSKGYGTDAIRVILWVGFNILGLHSIYLDTMVYNERAIHVYEKVGFKRVGVLRESEFLDGEFIDLLYMDILRDEFLDANSGFTVQTKT